jgi:hypothetical protein
MYSVKKNEGKTEAIFKMVKKQAQNADVTLDDLDLDDLDLDLDWSDEEDTDEEDYIE